MTLEVIVAEIGEMLGNNRLPRTCSQCGAETVATSQIQVEHDEFCLVLPIRICATCLRKPLVRVWVRQIAVALLLFIVAGFLFFQGLEVLAAILLAAGLIAHIWLEAILEKPASISNIDKIVSTIAPYRHLVEAFPDCDFSLVPNSNDDTSIPSSLVTAFRQSIQPYSMTSSLSSDAERNRSTIPLPIVDALVTILDQEIRRFFTRLAGDACWVQVAIAVLPGRRNVFEIQGLPGEMRFELEGYLSGIPSWPVAYPVAFVVQRRKRGKLTSIQQHIDPPFAWQVADSSSCIGDALLRRYRIATVDGGVEVTLDDIELLRKRLPEFWGLKALKADWLRTSGRSEECLDLLKSLVTDQPGVSYFRFLLASCLESMGQFEHAAAACQTAIQEFPQDVQLQGFLAHLQLKLGRPQDAIETASRALRHEELPELYVVRAKARLEVDQVDGALADLTVAVFQDSNVAKAYLLRSRIWLSRNQLPQALADLNEYHRTAGPSSESVYLKSIALRRQGAFEEAIKSFDEALIQMPDELGLRLARVECLAEAGKLEHAWTECEAILEKNPDYAPALATRAAVQFERGQLRSAKQDADRALELGMENSLVYYVRGMVEAQAENFEQAESDLSRAVDFDAENAAAQFHLGRIRALLGDVDAAVDSLSAAIRLRPRESEGWLHRGAIRLNTDRLEEAYEDFDAVIQISPQSAEGYRGRAEVQKRQGKWSCALDDLNRCLQLDPENIACRLARAEMLLENDDSKGAMTDLDLALNLSPDLLPALFRRAHLYLLEGRHDSAVQDFDAILEQEPTNAMAWIGRSVAYELAGDPVQAESDFREAEHLSPDNIESSALIRLLMNAGACLHLEQFDKVITLTSDALERDADNIEAYHLRAAAYWYAEQFVEAVEDYERLLECDPEDPCAYYSGRGSVYSEMGEFAQACDDLNRAVGLARQSGPVVRRAYSLNGLGRAQVGLGLYEDAEKSFAESLELRPDNAWLHFNWGLLHMAKGDLEKAAHCFDLSLHVANPRLTPRKTARARGFLKQLGKSP